jgi:hypothetical protein
MHPNGLSSAETHTLPADRFFGNAKGPFIRRLLLALLTFNLHLKPWQQLQEPVLPVLKKIHHVVSWRWMLINFNQLHASASQSWHVKLQPPQGSVLPITSAARFTCAAGYSGRIRPLPTASCILNVYGRVIWNTSRRWMGSDQPMVVYWELVAGTCQLLLEVVLCLKCYKHEWRW